MANGEEQATQRMLNAEFEADAQTRLDALLDEYAGVERERDALNSRLNRLRIRIKGLTEFLSGEEVPLENPLLPGPSDAGSQATAPSTQTDARTTNILAIAERILAQQSPKHMHYTHLADAVSEQGGNLPQHAKSRHDTLIRMMNEDPQKRFVRPERRGYYALTKDHPDVASVGSRRTREPG